MFKITVMVQEYYQQYYCWGQMMFKGAFIFSQLFM